MTQKTLEIKETNFLEERNFHLVQIVETRKLPSIIRAIHKPVLLKKNDFKIYS